MTDHRTAANGSAARRRWPWITAAAVLLALVAVVLLGRRGAPVEVVAVAVGPVAAVVEDAGSVRFADDVVVTVPSGGLVVPRVREPGAQVAVGDTLALAWPPLLDPATRRDALVAASAAAARVTAAERALEDADGRVASARADSTRAAALRRAGALAVTDEEAARTALAGARALAAERRAALVAAEGERRLAEQRLARGGAAQVIRAPHAGIVLDVHLRDPQVVPAGVPLLRLADPADVEVIVDVLSRDALRVAEGQPVAVDFGDGVTWSGTVRQVEPAARVERSPLGVEERRVRVHGTLGPDGADAARRAGDGARAYVAITVAERDGVPLLPATTFVRTDDGWLVYRIADRRVAATPVRVGTRGRERWEVTEGVAPGDRVVLVPGAGIEPGMRVRPVAAGAAVVAPDAAERRSIAP